MGGRWEQVRLGDEGGGHFREAELRMSWMPGLGGAQVCQGAGQRCLPPLSPTWPQAAAQHLLCPEPSYFLNAAGHLTSGLGVHREALSSGEPGWDGWLEGVLTDVA